MVLYLDGAVAGTAAYDEAPMTGSTPLCLGCRHNTPDNFATVETLGGLLDEVLLYARALPAAEVELLASGSVPAAP